MSGEEPGDILLVRPSSLIYPTQATEKRELQIAHGLILRCFWKRWLGLSVDSPIRMILDTGAMGVLTYVPSDKTDLW
jgi:broad specificity phosphatase PhoE